MFSFIIVAFYSLEAEIRLQMLNVSFSVQLIVTTTLPL